jgi:Tfp pilus assembly protein PilF
LSKNATIGFQHALLYLDEGNTKRAKEQLLDVLPKAVEEGKDDVLIGALCCLGDLHMKVGENAEAIACFERVMALPVVAGFEAARIVAETMLKQIQRP